MLKKLGFLACLLAVALVASPASAAVFGGDGTGSALQAVLDGITVGGDSSVNVLTDELSDDVDSYWAITASGGSVATFVVEIGGNTGGNRFGIFDASDHTNLVVVFDGADTAADQATISILVNGDVRVAYADDRPTVVKGNFASGVFGYFIDTRYDENGELRPENLGGNVYYSDTSLNTDGQDHLYVYQGTSTDTIQLPSVENPVYLAGEWTDNEFLLAFEAGPGANADKDYDDLVVMVESVRPVVPEPAAVLVWGFLAAVGICLYRRRK